eukprot:765013-Hanusia_phi.AAC.3
MLHSPFILLLPPTCPRPPCATSVAQDPARGGEEETDLEACQRKRGEQLIRCSIDQETRHASLLGSASDLILLARQTGVPAALRGAENVRAVESSLRALLETLSSCSQTRLLGHRVQGRLPPPGRPLSRHFRMTRGQGIDLPKILDVGASAGEPAMVKNSCSSSAEGSATDDRKDAEGEHRPVDRHNDQKR